MESNTSIELSLGEVLDLAAGKPGLKSRFRRPVVLPADHQPSPKGSATLDESRNVGGPARSVPVARRGAVLGANAIVGQKCSMEQS